MVKKISIIGIIVIVVGGAVFLFARDGSAKKDEGLKTVAVAKGTIVDKALAVGKIDPKRQINVKSKLPGLIKVIHVQVGENVHVGDALFTIAPDPTPIEFAETKRQVELAQVTFDNQKRELDRKNSLRDKQLISNQEWETQRSSYEEAELHLKLANERLALIETGHIETAGRAVDNVIKSNVNGMVLSLAVEQGDPVVPLTTYQAGTDLMTIAYMEDLIFKGNVDEIDVGKLHEGMHADLEIGAIPNQKIKGTLTKVSPKAHKEEGSTLFEVEIQITDAGDKTLRAGYSANASIIINQKDSVLVVPERLVKITDSVSTVEVKDSLGQISSRTVKTGLSDGINIEVTDGLKLGDSVIERPPKEIKADD